jgi:lipoyl(octanoyl) transferase
MIRLLPTLTADGPEQMARDEALLETSGVPTLRLYRWEPMAVSLGCFQEHAASTANLPVGVAVVRRITGGGAIWHADEVTYCLAGCLGQDGLPGRARDLYPLIHGAVLAALARRGATLALQPQSTGDRRYAVEPRCFASPAIDDLVHADGGKALGSAARARGERVVMHGSLKLQSNAWDRDAVTGCGLDWETAAAALREGVSGALGLALVPGDWQQAELDAAARIRRERYGDDAWVVRRAGPRP